MTTLTDLVPNLEPDLIASGSATEGPVVHPDGSLTFVQHRLSQLVRWTEAGGSEVIRTDTGHGNGCTRDLRGNLLMCEGGNRRITSMNSEGRVTTIADRWRGRRFNAPNDIICRSDGLIYFTDPEARTPVKDRELGFPGVFILKGDDVVLGTGGCEYPNGLAFSPDERLLYVAITRRDERCIEELAQGEICLHRRIRVFDVHEDGSLSGNRVFADMTASGRGAPDGLKVDSEGRVWATGADGVWVFTAEGELIGILATPELPARNLAFDGLEQSVLYVAAGDSIYRYRTTVQGLPARA